MTSLEGLDARGDDAAPPDEPVAPVAVAHPVECNARPRARRVDEPSVAEVDAGVPDGARRACEGTFDIPRQDVERPQVRIADPRLGRRGDLRRGPLRQRPTRVS